MRRTGIGPALQEARLLQGKSIEEASRDTRIRPEYLQALEGERYESLIGEPYVRGFLRSYSTYLGLDADKVAVVYNRTFGPPRPAMPEPRPGPARSRRHASPHLTNVVRDHPSWALMIGATLLALVVFGSVGLLSSSRAVPPSSGAPGGPSITVLPPSVELALTADRQVRATVQVDGRDELPEGVIRGGQGFSFEGTSRIEVWVEQGGVVQITVNGHSLGRPGAKDAPYAATFGPQDFRRSPSESSPGP